MSNEALVPYSPAAMEATEEALSRQFHTWEKRGRGWRVYDYAVEIEPPFEPFLFVEPPSPPPVDDGRVQGFFSRLIEGRSDAANASLAAHREQMQRYEAWLGEDLEPEFCSHYVELFREVRLLLPEGLRPAKPTIEQFLTSLAFTTHPISFEVIGTEDEVTIQFCATEDDVKQLKQQFAAHLPEASVIESSDHLETVWINGCASSAIVDFGLSEEFFLPLGVVSNLEIDPLIAIVGAMSELHGDEVGVFQVLLKQARYDWPAEVADTVRRLDEIGYFTHRPETKHLCGEKLRSPLYAVVLRAAARGRDKAAAVRIVRNIAGALAQLARPGANELIPLSNDAYDDDYHQQALLERQSFRCGMLLNREELVSLVHPPAASVRSVKLVRMSNRTRRAPGITQGNSLHLGVNEHQGESLDVTVSNDQRTRHMHLVGSSGSGKSTLLLGMIKQDLESGQGVCVLDPHGDLIDDVIEHIPDSRIGDVILFDPSDADYPVAFNILEAKTELEKTILSSDLIATFRRMSTSWGDVMDSVLANAILAIVENTRGGTLFDLKRLLVEPDFRASLLETATDENVRYFWQHEFPLISGKPQSSILIRLDAFLRQKLVRNIVCQKNMRFNFRDVMDRKKILLLKLSQGLIGEENAFLLGTLLVSKIYQTALTRQDSANRPHFWMYIDEFHHFITPSMERVLAGTRKYNLGLVLAHQEFRQMQSRSQDVASSVLSNCYTRVCFRMGDGDAERFAGGFSFFDAKALQNLGVGEAIGRVERAEYDFNLRTAMLPPIAQETARQNAEKVAASSRRRYARPRADVEKELEFAVVRKGATGKTERATKETKKERAEPETPPKTAGSPSSEPFSTAPTEPVHVPVEPLQVIQPVADNETRQHKYLQSLVKRIGESMGFRATLEKSVLDRGGRVDVALEKDQLKIACEISVTNEAAYEIKNVKKCLDAAFDRVVVISSDERHLKKIKKLAAETILEAEHSKIEFLSPETFYAWLETVAGDTIPEETVKGFKVKLKVKPVDQGKQTSKTKAISNIVLGAIKRLKNRPDKSSGDE